MYFYGPVDHWNENKAIWCGKTIHGETRLITAVIEDGLAASPPFIQYGYPGGCDKALMDLGLTNN